MAIRQLMLSAFLASFLSVFLVIGLLSGSGSVIVSLADTTDYIDPNVPIYWKSLNNYAITDVAIDPIDPANIYASSDNPTTVALSYDFGATWITKTVDASHYQDGKAIAVDPISPNYVYVSTFDGHKARIYRSDNKGITWKRVDGGIAGGPPSLIPELLVHPITSTIVFGGSEFGTPNIYRSDNRGESWATIPLASGPPYRPVLQILVHPTKPNRIFAVVEDRGVFVSEDVGLTWTNTGMQAEAIAIDSNDPDVMYKLDCYPYRSMDAGASWSQLDSPRPCYQGIHIDPQDSDILYLTSQFTPVARSMDAGLNWKVLNNPPYAGPFSSWFAIDPVDTTRLYVGGSVFVSIYLDKTVFLPIIDAH